MSDDAPFQRDSETHELANAAAEGLVACENGTITGANTAFEKLLGASRAEVLHQPFVSFVSPRCQALFAALSTEPRELELVSLSGETITVEMVERQAASARTPRRIYAVQDVRNRSEAEAQIRFLADHDALTGIPSRTKLNAELAQALDAAWSNDEQLAVFALNLDRFKEVNDLLGQDIGDAVLKDTAARIIGSIGKGDFIARLGGDEFAVISRQCDPGRARALAEALIASVSHDIVDGSQATSLGLSVGIALFPSHGSTPEKLLSNANVALTHAKAQGGGVHSFFNSHMDTIHRERRALSRDLAQAIEKGELQLFYQPQAKVSSLSVTGFEALLRWQHQDRGFVPPDEFITLAEECGLITEIGLWVLRRACSDAAEWKNALDIAVNISPLQFQQGDLPERILSILMETGLPASRLELEITETVLIKDFDRALSMLRRLKALGLRIAMDDFGTGWSSLASLQAFPFDKLKIDRTFIDKIGDYKQADAIVRAVLGLGRNLGIPVLAEGVETEQQLEFLRDEGCEELQGYLLSRPAPISSFSELIEEMNADWMNCRVA